eukprot:jgi/Ulvmu1/9249/UM005_0349.1
MLTAATTPPVQGTLAVVTRLCLRLMMLWPLFTSASAQQAQQIGPCEAEFPLPSPRVAEAPNGVSCGLEVVAALQPQARVLGITAAERAARFTCNSADLSMQDAQAEAAALAADVTAPAAVALALSATACPSSAPPDLGMAAASAGGGSTGATSQASVVSQLAQEVIEAFANAVDGAKACIRCGSAAEFLAMEFALIVDTATADAEAAIAVLPADGTPAPVAGLGFAQVFLEGTRGPLFKVLLTAWEAVGNGCDFSNTPVLQI